MVIPETTKVFWGFFSREVWRNKFVLVSLHQNMNYEISESVSQRGDGAYDEENRRIQEVSNELQRLCRLEGERPTRFEIEQRVDMYVIDAEIARK